jgi:hypothetical protein
MISYAWLDFSRQHVIIQEITASEYKCVISFIDWTFVSLYLSRSYYIFLHLTDHMKSVVL